MRQNREERNIFNLWSTRQNKSTARGSWPAARPCSLEETLPVAPSVLTNYPSYDRVRHFWRHKTQTKSWYDVKKFDFVTFFALCFYPVKGVRIVIEIPRRQKIVQIFAFPSISGCATFHFVVRHWKTFSYLFVRRQCGIRPAAVEISLVAHESYPEI